MLSRGLYTYTKSNVGGERKFSRIIAHQSAAMREESVRRTKNGSVAKFEKKDKNFSKKGFLRASLRGIMESVYFGGKKILIKRKDAVLKCSFAFTRPFS